MRRMTEQRRAKKKNALLNTVNGQTPDANRG